LLPSGSESKTGIRRAVLHSCETLSLTLREKQRVKVFEYCSEAPKGRKGTGENCIMRSFMNCTSINLAATSKLKETEW
jgi:hypothetical protein